MRAFIVLCCLATTYAASVGYDYERPGAGSIGGFGTDQGFNGGTGGSNGGGSFGSNNGGNTFGSSNLGGSIGGNNGGSSFGDNNGVSSFGDNSGGSGVFGGPSGVSSTYGAPVEFTKEFYSYTAPEGAFEDTTSIGQLGNSLKRGLRVVFIKGPENSGLENAALQLAKSANEQRTAIYVLNKQADIGDLTNKLNNLNTNVNSKPEVHFVKYRTPADAENAKRVIQAQYDSLGGKSSSINGGVAPVLDFASKAPVGSGFKSSDSGRSYLPPAKRV